MKIQYLFLGLIFTILLIIFFTNKCKKENFTVGTPNWINVAQDATEHVSIDQAIGNWIITDNGCQCFQDILGLVTDFSGWTAAEVASIMTGDVLLEGIEVVGEIGVLAYDEWQLKQDCDGININGSQVRCYAENCLDSCGGLLSSCRDNTSCVNCITACETGEYTADITSNIQKSVYEGSQSGLEYMRNTNPECLKLYKNENNRLTDPYQIINIDLDGNYRSVSVDSCHNDIKNNFDCNRSFHKSTGNLCKWSHWQHKCISYGGEDAENIINCYDPGINSTNPCENLCHEDCINRTKNRTENYQECSDIEDQTNCEIGYQSDGQFCYWDEGLWDSCEVSDDSWDNKKWCNRFNDDVWESCRSGECDISLNIPPSESLGTPNRLDSSEVYLEHTRGSSVMNPCCSDNTNCGQYERLYTTDCNKDPETQEQTNLNTKTELEGINICNSRWTTYQGEDLKCQYVNRQGNPLCYLWRTGENIDDALQCHDILPQLPPSPPSPPSLPSPPSSSSPPSPPSSSSPLSIIKGLQFLTFK